MNDDLTGLDGQDGGLADLVGVNDDLTGLDGQDGGLADLIGGNKDLTGLDGRNYNRDNENVFRWSRL